MFGVGSGLVGCVSVSGSAGVWFGGCGVRLVSGSEVVVLASGSAWVGSVSGSVSVCVGLGVGGVRFGSGSWVVVFGFGQTRILV